MKQPKNAEDCAKMYGAALNEIIQLRYDLKIERRHVADACQRIAALVLELKDIKAKAALTHATTKEAGRE